MLASLLGVAALALAGFLPAVAITRAFGLGLAVAPLAGGVVATVAGLTALQTGTPPAPWYVGSAVAAGAGSWLWISHTGVSAVPQPTVAGRPWWQMALLAAVIAVPFAVVARAGIDWDAQSIWLHKAGWFAEGGDAGREAFGEPQATFSHPDYPPLLPAASGVVSAVTGGLDLDRTHQAVAGALGWSALCVLAVEFLAVGRSGSRRWLVTAGVTMLAACSLGTFRLANGEADMLWSFAAVAAGLGMLRPRGTRELALPALACLVAMLTKDEGLAAGMLIVLGAILVQRPLRSRWGLLALPAAAGAVALLMRLWAADPEPSLRPGLEPTGERLRRIVEEVWQHLREPAALALVATALLLALPALRYVWPPANAAVLACWAVVAANLVPLIWTYVHGPHEIAWWLATSVERTTITTHVALVVIVGLFAAVALEPDGRGPEDGSLSQDRDELSGHEDAHAVVWSGAHATAVSQNGATTAPGSASGNRPQRALQAAGRSRPEVVSRTLRQ